MTLTLPVGSILYFESAPNSNTWIKLSEHNRSPVSIETYRHEQSQRMANGSLRKLWIADKKEISTSWSMLPSYATMTVDGGYGAWELRNFYLTTGKSAFRVKVAYNGVREEIFNAFFTSCSFTIIKRNVKEKSTDVAQEFWDANISLEEV